MTKRFLNPNDEVESWKDKTNEKIKNLHKKELGKYFEKEADKILEKYGVHPKSWHPKELLTV